jgi:spore germination cell wall hydrolase CwlJ-like protein
MRNLLTEVSKIKLMMGLKPNINEQSLLDTWSSMAPPKDQMKSDSGDVIDGVKKMMFKTITPKNDLTKDDLIVAATIWGEARGEGTEGMKAVANVIRNRANSLNKSPKDVVLQKKQFSIWNDTTTDNFLNKINKSTLKNPKDGSA